MASPLISSRDFIKRISDPNGYTVDDGLFVDGPRGEPTIDQAKMTARALISCPRPDRSTDVLVPKGCNLDDYRKNPVVLFEHGKRLPFPIGKSEDPTTGALLVDILPHGVEAVCVFSQSMREAAQIFGLIVEKIVRAASVYMDPKKYAVRAPMNPRTGRPGFHVDAWDLIEWSWCALGDNPDALAKTLSTKRLNGEALAPSLWHSLASHAPRLTHHVRGVTLPRSPVMTAPAIMPKDWNGFPKSEPVAAEPEVQALLLDLQLFPTREDALDVLAKSDYKVDGLTESEYGWYAPQLDAELFDPESAEPPQSVADGIMAILARRKSGAIRGMSTRSSASVQPGRTAHPGQAGTAATTPTGGTSGGADRVALSAEGMGRQRKGDEVEGEPGETTVAGEPSVEPLGGQVLRGLHSALIQVTEVVRAHRGQLENPGVIKLVDKYAGELEKMVTEITGKFGELYPDAGGLEMAAEGKSDDLAERMVKFIAGRESDGDLLKGISRTIENVAKVDGLAPAAKSALARAQNQFSDLLTRVEETDPTSLLDDASKTKIDGLVSYLEKLESRLERAVPK